MGLMSQPSSAILMLDHAKNLVKFLGATAKFLLYAGSTLALGVSLLVYLLVESGEYDEGDFEWQTPDSVVNIDNTDESGGSGE